MAHYGDNSPPAYPGTNQEKNEDKRGGMSPYRGSSRLLSEDERLEGLKRVAVKYELAGGAVSKLRQLENYHVVIIADDSGSMGSKVTSPSNPMGVLPTRWEELRDRVVQVVELVSCLTRDGVDIYFLNRPPVHGVNDHQVARDLFAQGPSGYTPLTATYQRVLDEQLRDPERKLLILLATDGEPNALVRGSWTPDVPNFTNLLKRRPANRTPTCIMACTDSDSEMAWLNELDGAVEKVDVVDDYASEREQILKMQGNRFPFTVGDYVVKTLLGSMDRIYDELDERPLTADEFFAYAGRARMESEAPPPSDQWSCNIL